ncbi:MAG: hypothetical protein JSV03_14060 [Planctomycetota bacterium]|nr:MAG: hypothetical protein JSV03_14060 [Planctomycetota bacterium]
MAAKIKPGKWIKVKITSVPKAANNIKTMIRVFEKDQNMQTTRKRLAKSRPVKTHIRGGRPWADRPQRLPVVKIEPGATYRVFASVDVLRDLESVEKFVEIKSTK